MKVCKFGGSSLASSKEFSNVRKIILNDIERKAIILSAPGKRNKKDNKITDLLYLAYSHIKYNFDPENILNEIYERFNEIIQKLKIDIDLEKEFVKLKEKIKKGIKEEELVSRGEYFSALIMAKYLGYKFIDAKDVIFFNYDGKIIEDKTLKAIKDKYDEYKKIVIPGFYGSYPNGDISLFSRGGSDITASYVAKAIKASLYENWTDVSGILMADPKIVDNPRKIEEISYKELREFSYSGALVLHEETVLPLVDTNIPIEILNTKYPNEKGTLINNNVEDKTYLLTGITGKKNFVALTFIKEKEKDKLDILLNVLNVFKNYHVAIEHIPTGIDSFSVVIEKKNIEDKFYDIIADLKRINGIVDISEDDDIALIAVVGRNMIKKTGTSGRILSVFGNEKINIKLIAQGREEINIIVGISNDDFTKSIKTLYDKFAYEKIEL